MLVLEHLLVHIVDHSQLVHIDLRLVLEVLEDAQDREAVPDLDVLVDQPCPQIILPVSCITPRVMKIVEPQNAGGDAGRVVDAEEVLVFLLDVEHNDASDLHLGEQVLITKDEEDLAVLLVLLPQQLMLHDRQVVRVVVLPLQDLVAIALFLASLQALRLEVPVPERKYVPVDLDDVHGKVDVGEVEVDESELGLLLLERLLLRIAALESSHAPRMIILTFAKTHFYSNISIKLRAISLSDGSDLFYSW